MSDSRYYLGIDVGSTTVKALLIEYHASEEAKILWQKYERHETRQAEKVLEYLASLEKEFASIVFASNQNIEVFVTGSGGGTLAGAIGARYYQEVLCVSHAVESHFPDVSSVIELGGQDAKIIFFKEVEGRDKKRKIMTMNDKCAGGTGAVIDKIAGKLNLTSEDLQTLPYDGVKLHPVAGKCGVFAETDINGLQKRGAPPKELMASLYEAIVQQNLTVLTRGNALNPRVLLLGGPNTFVPGLREAWRANLKQIWQERKIQWEGSLEDAIYCPQDGAYFAAKGAVELGISEEMTSEKTLYRGVGPLQEHITHRLEGIDQKNMRGLVGSPEELARFKEKYIPPEWIPPVFNKDQKIKAYMGIDGGSTSTKGVLVDDKGEVIATEYIISRGNPIEDSKQVITGLREQVEKNGALLEVAGLATTGYAKETLGEIFGADLPLVETVAHTRAALKYYPGVDVIVDVGGQDIKIIHIKDGVVKDFKLNTQCSAGNGYFLQNTAEGFGFDMADYANHAFSVNKFPKFGYGCAVFLQTDIVDFQRQGWEAPEILAGLADVLPKNIWQYVAKITNLASMGKTFVLQGGTQKNLAAVKTQVDYIIEKFKDGAKEPEVFVHKHTRVCGAIGAALEIREEFESEHSKKESAFIGLDESALIQYESIHNESTRCELCKNRCIRTFINIQGVRGKNGENFKRLIIAPCEKGSTDELSEAKSISKRLREVRAQNPDMASYAAKNVWKKQKEHIEKFSELIENSQKKFWGKKTQNSDITVASKVKKPRNQVRLGFPRVLNHYNYQPFLNGYFEALGFDHSNFVFSDFSSEKLYKEGAKRGSVDPCFPAKIAISHIHNLLEKNDEQKLDYIMFPMVNNLAAPLVNAVDYRTCPSAVGASEMSYAAFTQGTDLFRKKSIQFLKPFLNLKDSEVLESQLLQEVAMPMGISAMENSIAVRAGHAALRRFNFKLQKKGLDIIEQVERENRVALLLLGRIYHNDPGINHGIMEKFRERGYPILTVSSLPRDEQFLEKVFSYPGDEKIHPLDISDVWKNTFSVSSSLKIWAAKVAARHPHIIPIELSNFKCGHDAMTYMTIEKLIEASQTPFFSFKEIDENNPEGSIKIRVETIDYFLKRYIEEHFHKNRLDAQVI